MTHRYADGLHVTTHSRYPSKQMGAFYEHLADAIVVNKARRPLYAAMTAGHSLRVSSALVWLERIGIPLAVYIDLRAMKFQRRGIPIIHEDFVAMTEIRAHDAPPRFSNRAPEDAFRDLRAALHVYRRDMHTRVRASDFVGAARASAGFLDVVEAAEEREGAHFAMTRHFTESLGLAALNSAQFMIRSNGATARLSRSFLAAQALGLRFTLAIDRMAQASHVLDAGIVVNDVPDIPFRRRWNARSFL